MKLFERLSITKALSIVDHASTTDVQVLDRARERIGQAGEKAVPKLIAALGSSRNPRELQRLLGQQLTTETLHHVSEALINGSPEVADALIPALAQPGHFDPNKLLDLFLDPDCHHKTVLAHALRRHGRRIKGATVLRLLDELTPEDRVPVAWLLGQIANPSLLPALIERLNRGDAVAEELSVRRAMVGALGRLGGDGAQESLVRVLDEDARPEVRLSVLDALVETGDPPIEALCRRLRDPDMRVQSRSQDILAGLDTPAIAHQVSAMLSDDDVEARRAAVEILNRKRDKSALPALVDALDDNDWWVRGRAADAVADRGGPVLIPTVVALLGRDDGERQGELIDLIQRLAGDVSPLDKLLPCLERPDAELRRGAVRALGMLGGSPAVDPLIALLDAGDSFDGEVLVALAQLGDPRAVDPLIARLEKATEENEHDSLLDALAQVTDKSRASAVIEAVQKLGKARDSAAWLAASERALTTLRTRFGEIELVSDTRGGGAAAATDHLPAPTRPTTPVTPMTSIVDSARRNDTKADVTSGAWAEVNPLSFKAGERLADRYRIIRQVGRGGFGIVVLAEDEVVGEQLILKFLAPHLAQDATAIQRFKHEIRYARRITHENVIRIYDMIALEGVFAIAMEHFVSHSLSAELRHEPRLPLVHGLTVLRQICRGLEEAHRVSVIHRDLKPGNILINDDEVVKIVDFGLAAAATQGASRLTRSGLLLGTPTYMAPEQIEGRDIDLRADIYSLGVLMYEMFTGRVPFEGANAIATLFQHLDARVVAPRAIVPSLPENLETIILKAMARAPEARHASVGILGDELDKLAAEVSP